MRFNCAEHPRLLIFCPLKYEPIRRRIFPLRTTLPSTTGGIPSLIEISGLEPLGRRRKEWARSDRPARAERAGASESTIVIFVIFPRPARRSIVAPHECGSSLDVTRNIYPPCLLADATRRIPPLGAWNLEFGTSHRLFGKIDLLRTRRWRRPPIHCPIHHFPHLLKPPVRPAQPPLRPLRRPAALRFVQTQFHLVLIIHIHSFHIFLGPSSQSHMDIRCPCEIFLKNIFLP